MFRPAAVLIPLVLVAAVVLQAVLPAIAGSAGPLQDSKRPSMIQHEKDIAVSEPGPHGGGGPTTAHPFFAGAETLGWVFRKRVLHPGAAIGSHPHEKDEIYYVISGTGELTLDGSRHTVGPGTAILTRVGSTHALRQTGSEDLTIIVSYLDPAPPSPKH